MVDTLTACADCIANAECLFFTHTGPASFPLPNVCELFRSCSVLSSCTAGCVTEDTGPTCRMCSGRLEGQLGVNVMEVTMEVESEIACKSACLKDPTKKETLKYKYHQISLSKI